MENIIPLFVVLPMLLAFSGMLIGMWSKQLVSKLAVAIAVCLVFLSMAGYYLVLTKNVVVYQIGNWPAPIGINYVLDGFSALMLLTVSVIALMASVFSQAYISKYTRQDMFFSLLMLMLTGLNGVILTGDLFNLYVFLEIASLSAYALVAFGCEAEEYEASFKYIIMGSLASAMILFGIILIYSMTGTFNMAYAGMLISKLSSTPAMALVLAMFIMGFGVKAAIAPFHAWLPDAHHAAPAPISAMLSGVLIKTIGFYALIRIIFNVIGFSAVISNILMALGSFSMVIGIFMAISQSDLKRLFAWSTVSHIGYIFLGVAVGTPLGILGSLFHLINHALFKSLLFLNAGAIEYTTGTRKMKDLGGISKVMPVTSATSLVGSMAISGIPPFNGFWSKFTIILALILSGHPWYALIAVIVSIVTLAVLLKVQKLVFFDQLKESLKSVCEAPFCMLVPMVSLALLCIVIGLFYPLVIEMILSPAVKVILEGVYYSRIVMGGV